MAPMFRRRTATLPIPGLGLDPGERVLASGATPSGPLVATTLRLLLPAAEGFTGVAWENVERATWERDAETLVVVESASPGLPPRRHLVPVNEAAGVLDVVREQVKASVVISRYVPVAGERGIRVNGRRKPGQQRLSWVVALDPGIDLDDPGVRSRVEAAVARVRAEVE